MFPLGAIEGSRATIHDGSVYAPVWYAQPSSVSSWNRLLRPGGCRPTCGSSASVTSETGDAWVFSTCTSGYGDVFDVSFSCHLSSDVFDFDGL